MSHISTSETGDIWIEGILSRGLTILTILIVIRSRSGILRVGLTVVIVAGIDSVVLVVIGVVVKKVVFTPNSTNLAWVIVASKVSVFSITTCPTKKGLRPLI
ncbi:hypothetical protein RhiirC2_804612 [Rhizophagus irregularis]|uniref:Uncharacterized protein n=1 Tax=Rhizophagus irregularis TaxID=588596 RepID=A0A2N1KY51_9GLOM|nr:hypothetical protein RhiirC2_804612 [Rhizophagus irregularis]